MYPSDPYIFLVEAWKNDVTLFTDQWKAENRNHRTDELSIWFADQFELIKSGGDSELLKEDNEELFSSFSSKGIELDPMD